MTFFEYTSVAFSIVLSLSAAQLLSNVRSVFDSSRRYWVHGVWVAHLLILHVIVWWSGWSFRDVQWNLGSFGFALLAPALLYVASIALTPSNTSVSLREHFLANRTLFFTTRGLLVLYSVGASYLLLGLPLLAPSRLAAIPILGICAAGVASRNPRIHGIIAILGLLFEILVIGSLRFQTGSLVPQ